jgi:hypothetical protein
LCRTNKSEEDKIFGGCINKPIISQNLKIQSSKTDFIEFFSPVGFKRNQNAIEERTCSYSNISLSE